MIETDVQFSWSGGGCLCAALMIKRTLVDCSHDREESAGQFSRSRGHWWTVLKIERTLVDTGHHHHVLSIDQESSLPVSSWSWELSTRHVCSSHNREDYNWLLSWSRGRWWTALLIKVCSSHDRVDTAAGVQLSWSRGHCSWCAALMIERTLLVCSSHDREAFLDFLTVMEPSVVCWWTTPSRPLDRPREQSTSVLSILRAVHQTPLDHESSQL
jgi:hypothetical protein